MTMRAQLPLVVSDLVSVVQHFMRSQVNINKY